MNILHLLFFGVLIPWLAWQSRAKLARHPHPPRRRHFVAVLIQLLLFLVLSLVVARAEGIPLFVPFDLRWPAVLAAALLLGGGIALMRPKWRQGVERREKTLHLFMPRDRTERVLWVAVAVAAGVSEEITYRGVMFVVLVGLTGNAMMAAVGASLIFGLSHIVQGWKSAGIISVIALCLHGLVAVSGSLYLAIAVHAIYDVIAGLAYGRLGEELGYPVDGIPTGEAGATA